MENVVEINDNYILESDLENYKQKLAEYNRLYDMENSTDFGDNVGNLSEEELKEMNNLEKELEELRIKGKTSIRLELVDDKVVFESDLKRYNELKAEYNRLYDMENSTDFGDNVDSLTPEEIEEMNKIETEISSLEEKGKKAINIVEYEGDKVLYQDLAEYKELKAEYNRLYDMQNGTDFGDNVDSLTPEEIEEMNKLEQQMQELKNKAEKVAYIQNPISKNAEKLENNEKDNLENTNDENLENTKVESVEEDLTRQTIIDGIDKEKELGDSLEEEKLDEWAEEISISVKELYEYDQKKFIEKLDNTRNLDEKLELIEQREQQIENDYKYLFDHNRKEAKETLEKQYESFKNEIKEKYNNDKSNGEYVWANFDKVKESRDYIKNNIDKDSDWKYQFDVLMSNLDELINNPTEESYQAWKENMGEFIQNGNFDVTKITPYLNAKLKSKNKDLNIDDNLNITGFAFQKKQGEVPEKEEPKKENEINAEEDKEKKPIKTRLKVVSKKAIKWMKEHKLVCIAIGLALTTALLFAMPATHMMINSALWNVGSKLGWSAAKLGSLNSTNIGLSSLVKGGKFAYEGASGMYTIGGTAGAQALYTSAGANLVGALAGLTGVGAIGTMTAAITKKIKNWKKQKNEPIDVIEKPEEKEIEEKEPEKIEDKEKVKEKETSTEQHSIDNTELLSELKEALQKSNETNKKLTEQNEKLMEENRMMNEKLNQMFKTLTPEQQQVITGNISQNKEIAEFSDERRILS